MKDLPFSQEVVMQAPYLKSFARKLTKQDELAKDLLQDTLYRALANEEKFNGGSLRAWMTTIMKNIFINQLRKNRRWYIPGSDREQAAIFHNHLLPARNQGDGIIMREELETEIEALHHDLRRPFEMMHEGFKYDEIAEQLDAPLGTIKSRIHLARKHLGNKLRNLYGTTNPAELAA